jgi:hypothetical protein
VTVRRVIVAAALVLTYWLAAIVVLGITQMGDCFPSELDCEDGRAAAFWGVLGVEAALFAGLAYAFVRLSRR